jgi:phenylpropionate dioxygenase-like ring-hydroxylating dioxygenase large terminal subunit
VDEGHFTSATEKDHTSVVHVTNDWYVVCESRKLRRKPGVVTLLGMPLVVYRSADGRVGALLDRCAHRNVPLSLGAVRGDHVECAYHGWQFDREGGCRVIPGLYGEQRARGRRVRAYPALDRDGFVWVYGNPDIEPVEEPFRFPLVHEPGYTTVRSEVRTEASLFSTAENALDVPHTPYLHGGLFRSAKKGKQNEIEVTVQRWHDRVQAEYVGEPRPSGLAGRLLAPGGGEVTHFDRFILPSIVQVEYRLGTSHICISAALTPVSDYDTRLFAVISFRAPVPGWVLTPFLWPIARRIFGQDAKMLKQQTDNIRRFGGERFTTTEIDVLGPHVYRLLKQAERGELEPVDKPVEHKIRMRV